MIHDLEYCSYSRIDKRVTQLVGLTLFGSLWDLV